MGGFALLPYFKFGQLELHLFVHCLPHLLVPVIGLCYLKLGEVLCLCYHYALFQSLIAHLRASDQAVSPLAASMRLSLMVNLLDLSLNDIRCCNIEYDRFQDCIEWIASSASICFDCRVIMFMQHFCWIIALIISVGHRNCR